MYGKTLGFVIAWIVNHNSNYRKELMEKRERLRQAKRQEQQRRTAEKRSLQEMIAVKAKEKVSQLAFEERRMQVNDTGCKRWSDTSNVAVHDIAYSLLYKYVALITSIVVIRKYWSERGT